MRIATPKGDKLQEECEAKITVENIFSLYVFHCLPCFFSRKKKKKKKENQESWHKLDKLVS